MVIPIIWKLRFLHGARKRIKSLHRLCTTLCVKSKLHSAECNIHRGLGIHIVIFPFVRTT